MLKLPVFYVFAAMSLPALASAQALDFPAAAGSISPSLARDGDSVVATWLEPVAVEPTPDRAAPDTDATSDNNAGFHGDAASDTAATPDDETPPDAPVTAVRFSRLTDGTWTEPTTIAQGPDVIFNWADFPSVVAAPDGTLFAQWPQTSPLATPDTPYAYDLQLAYSSDHGLTWQAIGAAHSDATATEHGFASFAVRGPETFVVWLDGRQMAATPRGPQTIRAGRLTTEGVAESTVLDERVCDCCQTGLTSINDALVAVYRDRADDAEIRDIAVVRNENVWSGPIRVAEDARVQLAISRDEGRTFDAPLLVDGSEPLGRVELVSNPDASFTVCWLGAAEEPGSARLLCARYGASGNELGRVELAVTQSARTSGFPRAVRYGDGLLVAWREPGDGEHLAVVHTALVSDQRFAGVAEGAAE